MDEKRGGGDKKKSKKGIITAQNKNTYFVLPPSSRRSVLYNAVIDYPPTSTPMSVCQNVRGAKETVREDEYKK